MIIDVEKVRFILTTLKYTGGRVQHLRKQIMVDIGAAAVLLNYDIYSFFHLMCSHNFTVINPGKQEFKTLFASLPVSLSVSLPGFGGYNKLC